MSDTPKFTAGMKMATVYNTGWGGRQLTGTRVIAKVYANGNFTLVPLHDGDPARKQWRHWFDGQAIPAGPRDFGHEHLEVWTPAIEAELVEQARVIIIRERLKKVDTALTVLRQRPGDVTDDDMTALEAAIVRAGYKEPT